MYAHILTQNALTVFAGNEVLTMDSSNKLFDSAIAALKEGDGDRLLSLMRPVTLVIEATAEFPEFTIRDGVAYYQNQQLGGYAVEKLMEFLEQELPILPIVNFIRRVMKNPSYRAVHDLYRFLEYGQLPLTSDGRFLAYKRIRSDWKDVHSGTISNHVGARVEMPRWQVDDNPEHTCSSGLHVCSMEYLRHFIGERIVAVAVDPADVVSIPIDYNSCKMRVCAYTVVEEIPMPEGFNHWDRPLVSDYDEAEEEFEEEEDEFGSDDADRPIHFIHVNLG